MGRPPAKEQAVNVSISMPYSVADFWNDVQLRWMAERGKSFSRSEFFRELLASIAPEVADRYGLQRPEERVQNAPQGAYRPTTYSGPPRGFPGRLASSETYNDTPAPAPAPAFDAEVETPEVRQERANTLKTIENHAQRLYALPSDQISAELDKLSAYYQRAVMVRMREMRTEEAKKRG